MMQQMPLILAETLKEVEQKRLDLCVRAEAAVYDEISNSFRGIAFQTEETFDQVYESLRNGRCKVMASRAGKFLQAC